MYEKPKKKQNKTNKQSKTKQKKKKNTDHRIELEPTMCFNGSQLAKMKKSIPDMSLP